TATDVAALDQDHGDIIDAIAMCPFRCGPADTFRGVDTELMRLYIPTRHGPHRRENVTERAHQPAPCWRVQHDTLDRLEPALQAAVQRVVIARLPVRAMRHELQRVRRQFMNETTVTAKSIAAAVEQIRVAGQSLPAGTQPIESIELYCARALQLCGCE